MKKVLLFSGALLAFSASIALAGGSVNYSWTQCIVDGGVAGRVFACGSNSGTNVSIGTFTTDAQVPDFIGVEVVIDIQSNGALPEWWKFNQSGSCRQNSLAASFDWSVLAGGCADAYAGALPQGGIAGYFYVGSPLQSVDNPTDPSRARLKIGAAVADANIVDAGIEYYAFRLAMNNLKTVGTGSCPGCATDVCLVLNSVKAAGLSGPFELCVSTDPASNPAITWQNGVGLCAATPAQNRTWGQVKSLYR